KLHHHVVVIVFRDPPEAVGDCLETAAFRRPRLVVSIGGTDDLRERGKRGIQKRVLNDDRVEGALRTVMTELAARNVEDDSVGDTLPIRLRREEDEFSVGIDEPTD